MQEGIVSLMQMAKDGCGHQKAQPGGTSVCFCTDRPYHGRSDRQFCHAGGRDSGRTPGFNRFCRTRVIAQTIGEKLPEGFQRAEFF